VPVGFNAHDRPPNPLHDGVRGVTLSNAGKKLAKRYESHSTGRVAGA